jgi:phosphoglycolate phosphatase-like HAD superfamily hydrolase
MRQVFERNEGGGKRKWLRLVTATPVKNGLTRLGYAGIALCIVTRKKLAQSDTRMAM